MWQHTKAHGILPYSLVIGSRLIERYERSPSKEKPHALARRAEGVEKSTGVALSQDAERKEKPSISQARQGDGNAHGTAQDVLFRMDEHTSDIPRPLRFPFES